MFIYKLDYFLNLCYHAILITKKVMKNIVKFDYLTRNAHKHKHFKNGKFPINLFNVYKSNIFRF